ncbi:formate dehydrogenase accessory sulfurtransferase FdhD [soil metagenome]
MEPHRSPVRNQQNVIRITRDAWCRETDVLAVEEPLEIRLRWWEDDALVEKSIAVTMRTPGADFELAIGFLFAEGIITSRSDYFDVGYCLDDAELQTFNIVSVTLMPGITFDMSRLERNFYTTSSCGVCGKATLEALEVQGCEVLQSGFRVDPKILRGLPDTLRGAQAVFEKTGGLHAAGLFDNEGQLLSLHEDVGRHNALDKIIGGQFIVGRARLDDCILLLSGRASFELLQKALMARLAVVAAVGAPSSLAVELAQSFGVTLVGFVRPDGFNIYTHPGRVVGARIASDETFVTVAKGS